MASPSRKPIQPTTDRTKGLFALFLTYGLAERIYWVAGVRESAAQYILYRLVELINQRQWDLDTAGRPLTSATAPINPAEAFPALEARTRQRAIKKLTESGFAAIEVMDKGAAVKSGLLTGQEATKAKPEAELYRLNLDAWDRIAERNRQLAAEKPADDGEEEPEDDSAELAPAAAGDIPLFDSPVQVKPGGKAKCVRLSPAARKELGFDAIRPMVNLPATIGCVLRGKVLDVSIAFSGSTSKGKVLEAPSSSPHSTSNGKVPEATFSSPLVLDRGRVPEATSSSPLETGLGRMSIVLDDPGLATVQKHLNGSVPLDFYFRTIHNAGPKYWNAGGAIHIAKSIQSRWKRHQASENHRTALAASDNTPQVHPDPVIQGLHDLWKREGKIS